MSQSVSPRSNPEKDVAVLRQANRQCLCDDCVAILAGIKNRIAVNPIATSLGLTSDFVREKHICSRCGDMKFVTHAAER